ncbi:hypothetical protein L9F63_021449 [Diploptera punctata]|uniref:PX domain-containing protein n=1 Tax=Diploptera punctata TaxID=6984 RepID=A0AAD7ZNW0_DIPPU|nr:hypothetical protein L9F63_021449 [Diploptera punctata]
MTQIFIPRYRLVDEPPGKPHYVYVVEVLEGGRHHRIERRYSAFHCLHRELRKCYSTPLFPPKRVRSCQPKVLERRRQSLEQYLQAMLRFGPSRAQVLAFLGVKKLKAGLECIDFNSENKAMEHQPIFNFKKDPYVKAEESNHLPDVVTQGVLLGLYGNTHC